MTSARMKPFSKSVWISPAACGASAPTCVGPRAHFLRARGEERLQTEQVIGRANHAIRGPARRRPSSSRNAARSPSSSCAISASIAAHTGTTSAPSVSARARTASRYGLFDEAVLGDVGDVHERLQRDQVQLAQQRPLRRVDAAASAPACPGRDAARMLLQQRRAAVIASLSPAFAAFSARCKPRSTVSRSASASSVLMTSMSRSGSMRAGDVHDVVVLEAAHDVRDRVGLADVREELVAEAFALRGAGDEPGDVDELDRRRQDLLRLDDRRRAPADAGPAPARRRRSDRSCRTDSSPPRRSAPASRALKSVDLPTLGRPTMPHLMPISATPHVRAVDCLACCAVDASPSSRAIAQEHGQRVETGASIAVDHGLLLLRRRRAAARSRSPRRLVAGMADAEPQAPEVGAAVRDHVAQPVVAAVAAAELEARDADAADRDRRARPAARATGALM